LLYLHCRGSKIYSLAAFCRVQIFPNGRLIMLFSTIFIPLGFSSPIYFYKNLGKLYWIHKFWIFAWNIYSNYYTSKCETLFYVIPISFAEVISYFLISVSKWVAKNILIKFIWWYGIVPSLKTFEPSYSN